MPVVDPRNDEMPLVVDVVPAVPVVVEEPFVSASSSLCWLPRVCSSLESWAARAARSDCMASNPVESDDERPDTALDNCVSWSCPIAGVLVSPVAGAVDPEPPVVEVPPEPPVVDPEPPVVDPEPVEVPPVFVSPAAVEAWLRD